MTEQCMTATDITDIIERERKRKGMKKCDLMKKSGVYYYHYNLRTLKRGPSISETLMLLDALDLKITIEPK